MCEFIGRVAMATSFEEARICVVAYAIIFQGKRYVFDNNNNLVAINTLSFQENRRVCYVSYMYHNILQLNL